MKIKISGLNFLFISLALFLFSCSSIKKMNKKVGDVEIKTDPEVLEVHGDSVMITITGKFPPKYFNKSSIMKIDPLVHFSDSDMNMEPIYIKGENVKLGDEEKETYNIVATISYEKGGSFKHSIKVPYTPKMKNAKVEAFYSFKKESKYDELDQCIVVKHPDTISVGTITTSLTVKPTDRVLTAGVEENEAITKGNKPGESDLTGEEPSFKTKAGQRWPRKGVVSPDRVTMDGTIFFEINRAEIRNSEKKGEAMNKIRDFVKQKRLRVLGVHISSYASPDGELSLNANLTNNRANNTFDYLKKELASLGIEEVQDSAFDLNAATKEDWDGFKKLVRESNLDDKEEILSIANSDLPLDDKEAAIRKLDSWDPYMVQTLLPKLRRSEIRVVAMKELRDLSEVRKVAKEKGLDSLSKKELILLAYNDDDVNRQKEIYENYNKRYPGDWVGENNLATLLIFQGNFTEAEKEFERLDKKYPKNPTIKNNLGVAKRFLREYDAARDNYTFAQSKGVDEKNNLGILGIKVGDYDGSVQSFESNRCDYNVALAYTLKKDYEKALEKIDCITNKTADVFYLRAIVGARQNDMDQLTTSLRRAVEMDSSIRDRAKKDLEFKNYWGTEEFKNALR